MKIFFVTIIFVLLIPALSYHSVKAICETNSDWPEAPCYGCAACAPDKEIQREQWDAYYQYKGVTWMKMMKAQMDNAIKNGTLQEWVSRDQANYNVWRYYYLNDQAPLFGNSSTVPEFPFVNPVYMASIVSLILIYKSKKYFPKPFQADRKGKT